MCLFGTEWLWYWAGVKLLFTPLPTLSRSIPLSFLTRIGVFLFHHRHELYCSKYLWIHGLVLEHDWLVRSYTIRGNWSFLSQQLTIVSFSSARGGTSCPLLFSMPDLIWLECDRPCAYCNNYCKFPNANDLLCSENIASLLLSSLLPLTLFLMLISNAPSSLKVGVRNICSL